MESKSKAKSFDSINLLDMDKATDMSANEIETGGFKTESEMRFKKQLHDSRAILVKKLEQVEQRLSLYKENMGRNENEERINMVGEKLEKDLRAAIQSIDELEEALEKTDSLDLFLRDEKANLKKAQSNNGFWSELWSKFCCGKCCGKCK